MKKAILFILLLVIIGGGIGYYQYHKPVAGVTNMTTDYQISATDLFKEYEEDETAANGKYLDKVMEVSGNIQNVSKEAGKIVLTLDGGMMFGIICNLDDKANHQRTDFKEGESVKLKGICTGMLMDVVLVRCVEI